MRFLLVNPADVRRRKIWCLQPQSVGYLAQALITSGHDVIFVDAAKDNVSPEKLAQISKMERIDVVGFYVMSPLIYSVKVYIDEIKRVNHDVVTIAGGPHPTFEPEHTLRYCDKLDFACVGDGEDLIASVRYWLEEKDKSFVPNLVWRNDGMVIVNKREFVDINKYRMPAWDIIKPDTYPTVPISIVSKRSRVAAMIATRGCPYDCSFCGVPLIAGRKMRTRKVGNILTEIELLVSKYKIEEVHFIDDDLTLAPRGWLLEFLNGLAEAKFPIVWALPSGTRIDTLDDEILYLMKKAGCYSFAVGVESANQKTLNHMKKGLTVQKVKDKLEIINKYGFEVQANFILGYPTESVKDMLKTIHFACSLNVFRSTFFAFKPFPGSKEWNEIKSEIDQSQWAEKILYLDLYTQNFLNHSNSIVDPKIVKLLQIYAYVRFFGKPRNLFNLVRRIKTWHQLKAVIKILFRLLFK